MAKARQGGVTIDGKLVPGLVLRGFAARDPELLKSVYHPPGTNADVVITLGLAGRPILVPMLLYHSSWSKKSDCTDFLRELEQQKAKGGEHSVVIRTAENDEKFSACVFEGFEIGPGGVIYDYGGMLGDCWFCEGLLKFYQTKAV